MNKMTLEIPFDLAESMRIPPAERLARVRRELAVRLYQKGLISFGKARELAQMSKWDFHLLLAQEGIFRRYDIEELGWDLETLEALN